MIVKWVDKGHLVNLKSLGQKTIEKSTSFFLRHRSGIGYKFMYFRNSALVQIAVGIEPEYDFLNLKKQEVKTVPLPDMDHFMTDDLFLGI